MNKGVEITSDLVRDTVPSPSLRINSESGTLHENYDIISTWAYLAGRLKIVVGVGCVKFLYGVK
jgi:hypothetical protein